MKRILIDTDAGVDDSVAIVYAARSPEVGIEAITTVSGNVPVREVTQNVLYLKQLLKLDVPVVTGADVPRARKLVTAPEVHGDDGVGGFRTANGITFRQWENGNAAMEIVHAARKFGRSLTILSLGPMTNLANAASIDAEAIRGVGNIVQMGGVFFGYGNTTEFTEFNVFVDPEAAEFLLNGGIQISFVPLDLTEQLFIPRDLLDKLIKKYSRVDTRLASLLRKALHFYIGYHRHTEKLDGCYLHDPVAAVAAVNPGWFKFVKARVSVETRGDLTAGMTVADFRSRPQKGNSRIAVSFDAVKVLRDITGTVFGQKPDTRSIRSMCLKERFVPDFGNRLR